MILGSGSSGNCTLVETSTTRVLVDAGFNRKETLRRLAALGASTDRVDGILISHEHSDHVAGLASLAELWRAPVYLTAGTLAEIGRQAALARQGGRPRPGRGRHGGGTGRTYGTTRTERGRGTEQAHGQEGTDRGYPGTGGATVAEAAMQEKLPGVECIQPSQKFAVGDIEVTAFSIPHDAADPVAYSLRAEGSKISIVTDLGYLPAHVRRHLCGSDLLVLESNHDLDMLKVGPYPWHIKQRVMSRTGHLSNHAVSEFLADVDQEGTGFDARARWLVLAHLSENNNNPDVARLSAEEALGRRASGPAAFAGELYVASQRTPLGPFVF
ncbi:MAG TPA: MBL fold metallo-hydrolase [Candidatus Binatia bacterium]|nr:MBL fold metallo-hydrolase [Candidatus Binatia bacterium]